MHFKKVTLVVLQHFNREDYNSQQALPIIWQQRVLSRDLDTAHSSPPLPFLCSRVPQLKKTNRFSLLTDRSRASETARSRGLVPGALSDSCFFFFFVFFFFFSGFPPRNSHMSDRRRLAAPAAPRRRQQASRFTVWASIRPHALGGGEHVPGARC